MTEKMIHGVIHVWVMVIGYDWVRDDDEVLIDGMTIDRMTKWMILFDIQMMRDQCDCIWCTSSMHWDCDDIVMTHDLACDM
jgi:hypothetical protein